MTARVLLAVNVDGHVFEQDFHVLDGRHSVILGMDFLTIPACCHRFSHEYDYAGR